MPWKYRTWHNPKVETKSMRLPISWPLFTKDGQVSYQYTGELPEGIYRNFDNNGDPYYTYSK